MAATQHSFEMDLDAFAKKLDLEKSMVVQKIASDLWTRIIGNFPAHRHPVDTGRARAGWALSIGEPVAAVPPKDKFPEGQLAAPPPEPDFSAIDGEQKVFIVNNVEYVQYLEAGHSKQAPNGFVLLSLMEVTAEIQAIQKL